MLYCYSTVSCSQPAFSWEENSVCRILYLSYNVYMWETYNTSWEKALAGGKIWRQSHVLKKFGKYHCISVPTEVLQKSFLKKHAECLPQTRDGHI